MTKTSFFKNSVAKSLTAVHTQDTEATARGWLAPARGCWSPVNRKIAAEPSANLQHRLRYLTRRQL